MNPRKDALKQYVKIAMIFTLMISLFVVFTACSKEEEATATKISTQEVKQGNLVIGLYADGRVSIPASNLDFKAAGALAQTYVVVGQTVGEGDLIASLEKSEFTQAVSAAQRDLTKAKAVYEDAVKSLGYSVASEKIKLDSLYGKLQMPFDDTDFTMALSVAQSKLEEKKAALLQLEEEYNQAITNNEESTVISKLENAVTEMQSAVVAAEASVNAAQKNLDGAFAKYQSDMATTKENYDLQKLKYDNLVNSNISVTNAKYSVDVAQAKVTEASENIKNADLYAPISGTVAQINGLPGAWMAGKPATTSTTGASSPFMILTDATKVRIASAINEGDIGGIELGQLVKVNVEALGLIGLTGKVVEISTIPKIDNSGIVTYSVIAELDEVNEQILDGMSTFVSFIKREKENVLLLSNKAIFMEEGKQYVWVQHEEEELEKREVVAGLTNGSQSEIVEGLTAGETVVTSGMNP
jgi:multidrug efflux pump subunit AcrA (membrane-fusion protein)